MKEVPRYVTIPLGIAFVISGICLVMSGWGWACGDKLKLDTTPTATL